MGRVIAGAWLSDAACQWSGEDRFDVRQPADAWRDVDRTLCDHHCAAVQAVTVSQLRPSPVQVHHQPILGSGT